MLHLTRMVAAALVLLAIVLGVYAWLLGRKPQPSSVAAPLPSATLETVTAAPLHPIVVTTRPVPAGQPIAADALRVAQLPMRPAGTFAAADAVVGRVSVFDLAEGTPLFENHLAAGLAQRLGEGERAVAVRADEVMGVGNRVQPGDFVDVFVVLKSDGREIDRGQARLLLARKRVLAFGAASLEAMPSRPGDGTTPGQAPGAPRTDPARTAVLAVPVAEVNRLALGESAGHLLLALRHPADMATVEPALYTGVTATWFAAGGAPAAVSSNATPAPAPAPATAPATAPVARRAEAPMRRAADVAAPRVNEVEFIRGDRRETLTY